MSGRYLACALNYEYWLTRLFGSKYGLGDTVVMALHFGEIKPMDQPVTAKLPAGIARYIERFEDSMTQDEYDDPRFAYRLLFTRRTANHKGQADRAVEFVKPGDPGSEDIEPERWLIKDTEKPKFRAKAVIAAASTRTIRCPPRLQTRALGSCRLDASTTVCVDKVRRTRNRHLPRAGLRNVMGGGWPRTRNAYPR
jgi:hypothetical protein